MIICMLARQSVGETLARTEDNEALTYGLGSRLRRRTSREYWSRLSTPSFYPQPHRHPRTPTANKTGLIGTFQACLSIKHSTISYDPSRLDLSSFVSAVGSFQSTLLGSAMSVAREPLELAAPPHGVSSKPGCFPSKPRRHGFKL